MIREKMQNIPMKRVVILSIPYLIIFYLADKCFWLYRHCIGDSMIEKIGVMLMNFQLAFTNWLPSFQMQDLLGGLVTALIFRLILYYKAKNAKKFRHGEEYGSARWGNRKDIEPFEDSVFENNIILTETERLTMNSRPKAPQYARNKNVIVIGGSGSGKTRFYVKPNLMQMTDHVSYVVTDPKGTIIVECGKMLVNGGYRIKVLNTINFKKSMHYNPFHYIRSEKDILKLVNTIIANTKGEGEKSTEDFWIKAERLLYSALIGYIWYEAPEEEQNFSTLLEFINASETREDDEEFKNAVDELFEELEAENPEHFAVRQYRKYKLAAGKTAKSILISVGVRLAAFNLKEIANLTCTDELDLASIGEKKVALFCCIPDADTSLNYLVGMIYSNLFQTLYYVADRKYGGRLPVPVHCIMDEWPNVALPDDFDKILATMRSRAISCSIIIQNMAQMKALFKDSWESLVGNCDELLYLGGNEKEGHKYISELLGKETLDTNTYGQTKGRNGSYSTNYQQTGRELFTPDEIRLLDNRKAILFVRGERPMLDDKYNLKKHPNVKWTEDGGAPPYDYAKAPRSHDDLNIDIERLDDYELLCEEDILGKEQPF